MSNETEPNTDDKLPPHVDAAVEAIIASGQIPGAASTSDGFKIKPHVIELLVDPGNAPVFDVQVSYPAIPRYFYGLIKQKAAKIVSGQPPIQVLVPHLVFDTHEGAPLMDFRIALVAFGDAMPASDSAGAEYIGTLIHPQNGLPINAYRLPPASPMDVSAALVKMDDIEIGGES